MMNGRRGEDAACRLLQARGYRIIARNWRTRMGELDIVAREGDVLAFVEVKARSGETFGGPLASIDVHKQRRIIWAANAFLGLTRCELPARFDVVTWSPRGPQLHRDAFQVPDSCSQGF